MEDHRIQEEPNVAPVRREVAAGLLPDVDVRRYRTQTVGVLFGGIAGIPLGALALAVCYWLVDFGDFAWEGALYGGVAGAVAGAVIGFIERTFRGDLVRPDVATCIGGVFGLAIAPLIFFGPAGGTVYVLVGIVCAGPMAGLLFGALFDRAFDSALQRHLLSAMSFGGLAVAACTGFVFLIAEHSDPEPDEVAKNAWNLIADHRRGDPVLKDAKMKKITLNRPRHRTYTGTMELSLAGQTLQFDLQVHLRHNQIKAEWSPRN